MGDGGEIVVYTAPGCTRCRAVMDHLHRRGARYRVVNIKDNFGGLREMVKKTGSRTVPVTMLDDSWVLGDDLAALDELIGWAGPDTG